MIDANEMVLEALRATPTIGQIAVIEQVWCEDEREWRDTMHRPIEWYDTFDEARRAARRHEPTACIGLVAPVYDPTNGERLPGWTTIDHEEVGDETAQAR